jgi:hypothetical protein
MIEKDIFDELKSLVGNRVYPLVAPQNVTLPFIIYTRISNTPQNVIEGGSTIDQVRIQVDTYASTYDGVKTTSLQVRDAMISSSAFKASMQMEQDFFETEVDYYRVSQDFYVWERTGS